MTIEPAVMNLKELIDYREGQINSRSMNKKVPFNNAKMTLLAVSAGESISKERSGLHKFILVIDGQLQIVFPNSEIFTLNANDSLFIPKDTMHEIQAPKDTKFLQIEDQEKA